LKLTPSWLSVDVYVFQSSLGRSRELVETPEVIDYILLMHSDATDAVAANDPVAWDNYFALLQQSGLFDGGSAIGKGLAFRKTGQPGAGSEHLSGFIRLRSASLELAQSFLSGNPVYEAGGTVEIRELPRD
jgi:hypothetical protein